MLRPATPLTVLLLVAFALLLISVISTPVVKGIPLASFSGIDYGVFGSCKGSVCIGPKVGYPTSNDPNFTLPSNTRHSLTSILIVHPIAALLTLVCLVLAATAHLHSPSHSPRYLLALIILLVPTLLITLLAFLVDILLFIPHLAWGGWIVLASTILIAICGVLTCAMRRTLVSRKARKKRIAENAEMNGDNFYNRQNGVKTESAPPLSQQPTAPMVNGAPGSDKLPSFATFENSSTLRASEDDRIPLNSRNGTAVSSLSGGRGGMSEDGMDRYAVGRGGPMRDGRGGRYNGPRDEFGNPLPPSAAFGSRSDGRRNSTEQRMRHQYSNETMDSQGSRGRGRGGYPPRGYGRGGPYNGRGGPGSNGRGGPGYNGRGGPGYNGNGRGGIPMGALAAGAGAGMVAGEMMGRGHRGPPPGYGNGYPPQERGGLGSYNTRDESPYPADGSYVRRASPGPPSAPGYGRQPSPGPPSAPGYGRQPSPGPPSLPGGYAYGRPSPPPPLPLTHDGAPPIGQAVEMDATTGSPGSFTPGQALRESDSDVAGFVGLQQNRLDDDQRDSSGLTSPSSAYSVEPYVPARAAWAGGVGRNNTPPINTNVHPLATVNQSPVELSAVNTTPPQNNFNQTPTHARTTSDAYYEDVDPRFAEEPLPERIPSLLMAGGSGQNSEPVYNQLQYNSSNLAPSNPHQMLEPASSYESMRESTTSPGESDNSNFTSVSRRGVNPDWRPGPGPGQGYGPPPQQGGYGMGMGMGGVPNRGPRQQQRPDVLSGNPDFELPGAGGRRGGGGMGGMI